jgi:hypothetical protein
VLLSKSPQAPQVGGNPCSSVGTNGRKEVFDTHNNIFSGTPLPDVIGIHQDAKEMFETVFHSLEEMDLADGYHIHVKEEKFMD